MGKNNSSHTKLVSGKPPEECVPSPVIMRALQNLMKTTTFAQLFRSRLVFPDIKKLPPLFPEPAVYYPLPVVITQNPKTFEELDLPSGCVGPPSKTLLHMGKDFIGWDIALPYDREMHDVEELRSPYAVGICEYLKEEGERKANKKPEYCYIRGYETPNDSVFEFFNEEEVAKRLKDLNISIPRQANEHDKNAQ